VIGSVSVIGGGTGARLRLAAHIPAAGDKFVVLVVASPTQGVKSSFSCLRRRRKWQIRLFGVRVTDARGKFVVLVVASPTQVANSAFWSLRRRRKWQIRPFRVRVADASGKFGCFAPASPTQAAIKTV
jgi:hypothetical protein